MFCDSCGTPLQSGQQFCTRCGKTIVGGVQPGGSRVARHAQMLGILWIAYSAMLVLGGIFLLVFFQHIFPMILRNAPPPRAGGPPPEFILGFMGPFMHFIAVLVLAKAAAGIIAGVGVLQRAPWSRVLTIVVAILSLISFPFGTALGIYSLWVLLSPNAELEFRDQGRAVGV